MTLEIFHYRAPGRSSFTLTSYVNDPTRTRDLDDIRALQRGHPETLDAEALKEYFRLFAREDLLEALTNEVRA